MKGNAQLAKRRVTAEAEANVPTPEKVHLTVPQLAASRGDIEMVRLLLVAGAHINAPAAENAGRTALQAANERGHTEVAKVLLGANADLNARPARYAGWTDLGAVKKARMGGQTKTGERNWHSTKRIILNPVNDMCQSGLMYPRQCTYKPSNKPKRQ